MRPFSECISLQRSFFPCRLIIWFEFWLYRELYWVCKAESVKYREWSIVSSIGLSLSYSKDSIHHKYLTTLAPKAHTNNVTIRSMWLNWPVLLTIQVFLTASYWTHAFTFQFIVHLNIPFIPSNCCSHPSVLISLIRNLYRTFD